VTAGRYFRKRSPGTPPFEGGRSVESERMFGPVSPQEALLAAEDDHKHEQDDQHRHGDGGELAEIH